MGDVSSSDIQSEKFVIFSSRWTAEGTLNCGCCSLCYKETKTWFRQKVDETKTTVFESSKITFPAELQSVANIR